MELLDAHGEALRGFDRVIRQVGDDQWHAPTPCTDWDVHALVNHMVSEQLWAPHLLAGASLEDVGDRFDGDVLGTDPAATWRQASDDARRAWTSPAALDGSVHVTSGQIDATEYGWQMTTDLAVHGWDLARAIGVRHPIRSALAEDLIEVLAPMVDPGREAGIFGPSVPVATNADAVRRLLGMLGRDPG